MPILRALDFGKGVREWIPSDSTASVSVLGKWTLLLVPELSHGQAGPWPNFKVCLVYLLHLYPSHPSWHPTPLRYTLGTILPSPILGLLYLLSTNHIKVLVENSSRYYPFGNHHGC